MLRGPAMMHFKAHVLTSFKNLWACYELRGSAGRDVCYFSSRAAASCRPVPDMVCFRGTKVFGRELSKPGFPDVQVTPAEGYSARSHPPRRSPRASPEPGGRGPCGRRAGPPPQPLRRSRTRSYGRKDAPGKFCATARP